MRQNHSGVRIASLYPRKISCLNYFHSSTIIEDLLEKRDPTSAVVFFYFDFNDSEKQSHENLLRSLMVQLCTQSASTPKALQKIYSSHQDGMKKPSSERLIATLREIFGCFRQNYIVLDALDECANREELLVLIEEVIGWKIKNLHILATSRKEGDIEEVLEPLVTDQICIQSALINADIRLHIRERLEHDRVLRKRPKELKDTIEATLMEGAHGM